MNAPQQPPPRNRLGTVTFVIAVLGAVLAVIPATVAFGGLLCIIAIIPAIISFRRVRKGTADNRRQSVAALVLAPVFFIVAVSLTPSPPADTTAEDSTPMSKPAGTPELQQSSPAITPLPALEPAPAPAVSPAPHLAPAPALAPAPTRAATPAPARAAAPAPAPVAAPASPAAPRTRVLPRDQPKALPPDQLVDRLITPTVQQLERQAPRHYTRATTAIAPDLIAMVTAPLASEPGPS